MKRGPYGGSDVGYDGAHVRMGKANQHRCVDCGKQAQDWSYIGGDPNEKIHPKKGHAYSTDPAYYVPRCKSCHKKFDHVPATHCGRGHEFTPENTRYERLAKGGWARRCRTCRRNDARAAAKKRREETPPEKEK